MLLAVDEQGKLEYGWSWLAIGSTGQTNLNPRTDTNRGPLFVWFVVLVDRDTGILEFEPRNHTNKGASFRVRSWFW